ncbi:ABC transporter substrate-binding protein [Alkalicoccobacillus murimartini]|uniref:Peptide/nickel transport system substrate-binding protein n=1 Tax=Alkalicoccobacillus murimartini TaxID=171685 RepID=A0ABT9YHE8_9BACI|nr:ABC transporter substrate-binding protein [Alkalicoccobacillus murimartini]MDQ0207293.1 peptide/nickel transport system substrate-binding protein [Alkalicoccobacillus murimartini]
MKKKAAILASALALTVLGACNVTTREDAEGDGDTINEATAAPEEAVDIELLSMSSNEQDINILRDQLTKNGFNVKINQQPDYGSFTTQRDAGNFDIAINSWTTVTGNPDYAIRSLFKSDGDNTLVQDDEVDALIEKAATESPEEYTETYKELELKLVEENAYIAPLYNSLKNQVFNKDVLDSDTVRLSKSRAFAWDSVDFVDESRRDTDPLVLQQSISELTSLDPIKGNDGSINQLNTNMYVRLVNLTDDDEITPEASLSYDYSIAEGNSDYYFVLRDDINFASIEDGEAVDTGERVGADDVIFSLERASDPNSVPDHRTFTLHEHIDTVEAVDNLADLEGVNAADESTSIKDQLEDELDQPINELVTNKDEADSSEGKYQVIKLTTTEPFPQVLNYLAHQSAGIVSKDQVESINTYDIDSYDAERDIAYGDQRAITEGDTYDNHLYTSGPYILNVKNDYEAKFLKNPGYQVGTEYEPNISEVDVRFIADADAALSALRSNEIDLYYGVAENKMDVIESEDKLELQSTPSNGVSYLSFNNESRDVAESEDLRKAVLYSINQDEIISVYNDDKLKAYSTLSPLVDTGNVLEADPEKVKEHLNTYLENR